MKVTKTAFIPVYHSVESVAAALRERPDRFRYYGSRKAIERDHGKMSAYTIHKVRLTIEVTIPITKPQRSRRDERK